MKRGTWRRIFLILTMLSGAVCLFSAWKAFQVTHTIIAYFLLPIIVWISVIGLEIYSVIKTGQTLSSGVTKALERYEKARAWIHISLISLILVLVFLYPHLVITGS